MGIDNSTRVPNHILDIFLGTLKEVELKVLLVIVRQTIGWNKPSDWIATSQLCRKTGACKKAVLKAAKALAAQGLVRTTRQDGVPVYGIIIPPQWNNVPSQRKNVHLKREYSSLQAGNNVPPTKDTPTKRPKVSSDKIKSIKEYLVLEGILKSSV